MDSLAENTRKCLGPFGCRRELSLSEFWGAEITCKACRKARKMAIAAGETPLRVRASRKALQVVQPVTDTPRVDYALMTYEGVPVAFEQDCSAVCLTDIWRAAGSPENNDPSEWLGQAQAKALVAQYLREHSIAIPDGNWTSRAGQYGGVWRPKEIALAYAQYLSPALYLACNRFVLNRSQQFIEAAPSSLNSEALEIINRLVDTQNAILSSLGVLPRIDQNTRTTAAALSGVEMMRIKQIVRCQIYAFRLLPDSPFLSISMRKFRAPPKPGDHIIAIGRTGPDGNVHELRLADYGGKFPFQPSDYELLCVIQTDKEESEGVLLRHPMIGCSNLVLSNGGRSKTFMSATTEGLNAYRALTSGYYTYEMLRELFEDSGQSDMFKSRDQ